jgi:hypothetical protein
VQFVVTYGFWPSTLLSFRCEAVKHVPDLPSWSSGPKKLAGKGVATVFAVPFMLIAHLSYRESGSSALLRDFTEYRLWQRDDELPA